MFGTYQGEKSSIILSGPNGYQRNLNKVMDNASEGNSGYPFKVTQDGSVIFIRQELLSSDSFIDTELLRLPFDGSKLESLLYLPPQSGKSRAFDINNNGDFVAVDYYTNDLQAGITFIKKHKGVTSSNTLVLPNGIPSRKGRAQSVTPLLADSGEIFLARKTFTRRSSSLLDVCVGVLSDATLSCSSRTQILPLKKKGFYHFTSLQPGGVVGVSSENSALIDLSDFSTKFVFRTNLPDWYSTREISEDLGSFSLVLPDLMKFNRFSVISQHPAEGKKRLKCSSPLDIIDKEGLLLGLYPGSKESFYMTISFPVGTALYEFRPVEVLTGGVLTPGTCRYGEKDTRNK